MLQAWEIIFLSAIQQNQTLKMPQVWKLLLCSCHTKIAENAHSPSLGKPILFFSHTTKSDTEGSAILEIPEHFLQH